MDEITEKTWVPKDLADDILEEIENLLDKGYPDKKAVRLGINAAIYKWELHDAYKSGG